jgi:glutathione S-transferase
LWTAEEAGADYELVRVEIQQGAHRSADYRLINPNARVPALDDDGLVLFESAAICQHIARKHPAAHLLPAAGSRDEALHDQWMFWTTTELEQPLWSLGKHRFALPIEHRLEAMKDTAAFEWERAAAVLDQGLADRTYIVGDHLTVADIMLGHTLYWARGFGMPFASERLERYLDHKLALPSFERTRRWE